MVDQPSLPTRPARAYSPAGHVALFLGLALVARLVLDGMVASAGWGQDAIFGPKTDLFADSIKQSLAVRAVSAPLLSAPKVLAWPPLFRHYLYYNDYLWPGNSADSQPPLAMLQLMAAAKVMVLADPMAALAVQFLAYFYGVLLIQNLLGLLCGQRESLWLASILLFAYPVLYMLDRGNFHAGYASLAAIFYMLTAYSGRWRGLGMFALCCAINLRPNLAVVALLEVALQADLWRVLLAGACICVGTLAMAAIAYAAAHSIDPNYTALLLLDAVACASAVLWGRARRAEGLKPSEAMMLWACLLLLCPVGDGRSSPIELAFLLLAAGATVAWESARRPAAWPVWRRAKTGYEHGHGHHLQG